MATFQGVGSDIPASIRTLVRLNLDTGGRSGHAIHFRIPKAPALPEWFEIKPIGDRPGVGMTSVRERPGLRIP